jgi:hypothetical protein
VALFINTYNLFSSLFLVILVLLPVSFSSYFLLALLIFRDECTTRRHLRVTRGF